MCKMIVVLAAGLLLLAALPASAGLAGFQYQREIAIQENSGETLRDYQVLVALAGSDFPEEAEVDGDDIRFTDADGRELSYWIEEFDAGSERAKIWVNVPLIPANGAAGVTMWYGNPGAESESDGEAVFEFFDDFEGTSLDTSKWQLGDHIHGVINHRVSNSDLITWSVSEYKVIKSNYMMPSSETGIVEVRVKSDAYDWWCIFYLVDNLDSGKNRFGVLAYNTYPKDHIGIQTKISDSDWAYPHDLGVMQNNRWYKLKIIKSARKTMKAEFLNDDGTLIDSYQTTLNGWDASNWQISQWKYGNTYAYWDHVFVRKYADAEPTIALETARSSALSITKSPTPHSIRQFQETIITISIKNSGTTDATDIEITDRVHPSFDLTSGDFPNPKRYDLIRSGETRDLQYTIRALESGTFTLDPATVTYADEDGNIQEVSSEPASLKVIPSTEGGTSGGTSRSNPSVSTASVQLHGEKTDVVLGEDILLKLSAVNLITKPTMHVQVIIIPPSGMSVTSSAFAKSGAGQYTTTYELEPGTGKDIEVAIRSNQVGDFDVNGRIIYYFGDDRDDAEDHTLILPITVRAEAEPGAERAADASESEGASTPGFAAVVAVMGLLAVYLRRKRR